MGLLEGAVEDPKSKLLRYFISGMVFVLLLAVGVWYVFRFHEERKTIESFFDAVIAGNLQRAYEVWRPSPTFPYDNFVADWGPTGYYGPVKSYHLEVIQKPEKASSGVIVVVAISPFDQFPTTREPEKHPRIREVYLWVEHSDQSISYAPNPPRRRTFFGR